MAAQLRAGMAERDATARGAEPHDSQTVNRDRRSASARSQSHGTRSFISRPHLGQPVVMIASFIKSIFKVCCGWLLVNLVHEIADFLVEPVEFFLVFRVHPGYWPGRYPAGDDVADRLFGVQDGLEF